MGLATAESAPSAKATVVDATAPTVGLRINRHWLLLIGALLWAASGMRWNISLLAWIAPVPFLLYARQIDHKRGWLWLALALQLGMALQIAKIVTYPLSPLFVPLFSVPMALSSFVLILLFELMRRRLGDRFGLLLFAALIVLFEWISWNFSEFGSWGASAYTQLENLPLMQTLALFGLSGIAALMAAVAAWTAAFIGAEKPRTLLEAGAVIAALILASHIYGSIRLFAKPDTHTVTVAGVLTDVHPSPAGFPDKKTIARGTEQLFSRSKRAIERGAKLVVWNEGATVVEGKDEAAFIERAQELAKQGQADLVLAYIVPIDGMKRFQNKYLFIDASGRVLERYLKHHPVPGEGAVKGTAPIRVLQRPYGKVAGAICYDYDFPGLAQKHAALKAGLVFVPSSDWLGIDPYHTQMARARAIEGGFSLLRPVRWATSAAYDHLGRPRATLSHFEQNERIMLAELPVVHRATFYSQTGDLLVWLAGLIVMVGLALVGRGYLRQKGAK
jgi:apolipoprotein N-acyltransferase